MLTRIVKLLTLQLKYIIVQKYYSIFIVYSTYGEIDDILAGSLQHLEYRAILKKS